MRVLLGLFFTIWSATAYAQFDVRHYEGAISLLWTAVLGLLIYQYRGDKAVHKERHVELTRWVSEIESSVEKRAANETVISAFKEIKDQLTARSTREEERSREFYSQFRKFEERFHLLEMDLAKRFVTKEELERISLQTLQAIRDLRIEIGGK